MLFRSKGQVLDAGAKVIHFAPNTTSKIVNKSICKDGGKTIYRGLLKVATGAHNVKSNVTCDALILDDKSSSDPVPYMEIKEKKGELVMLRAGASLGEVVKALNAVGASPQDLLAILQAMKAAGALRASLEII